MRERAVLVFAFRPREILLIHKLRGLGAGKVNGPGGRLEIGETFAEAGIREVEEETGTVVKDLQEVANLDFRFTNGYELDVRAFVAPGATGEPRACAEADPFWCPLGNIPWNQMWADDPLWLPHVLNGRYVQGRFLFKDDEMLWADLRVRPRSMDAILG